MLECPGVFASGSNGIGEVGFALPRVDVILRIISIGVSCHDVVTGTFGGDRMKCLPQGVIVPREGGVKAGIGGSVGVAVRVGDVVENR